ncbi:MAG: enoyl-CoA hydratase/isomerase family protein, partial [Candidatus Tectomicrobia bacterium]|nr:enoyl-CoA hydratase/isomerase family protein [Candidatus Tectomicrobia bacterium]
MTESHLGIATKNHVTTVTINRPEKRNALTYRLLRDLQTLMPQLADDSQTRVVVLRGAGTRAFSSGMDLNDVLQGVARDAAAPLDHELVHGAMQAVEEHPNPVIAMINGDAFAGGCELALHCDFRVMLDSARVGMPLAKRGLLIPFPLIQKLVHMVGPVAATEILLQGAPL